MIIPPHPAAVAPVESAKIANIFLPPKGYKFTSSHYFTQLIRFRQVLPLIFPENLVDFILFLELCLFLFPVDLSHTVKLFLFVGMESSLVQGIADLLHHRIVEIQIMKNAKSHAKHLFCF